MSIREKALEIARTQMRAGAREVGGNNKGPFVRKYLAPTGLGEGHAWCASFVSWCYKQASHDLGVPMPFPYSPGVRRLWNVLKAKGWDVDEPLPGDLMFWTRGGRNSGLGHMGFSEYAHDGLIQTIEGNHTAKVERFHYEWKHEARLLGFARVPG